MCFTSCQVRVTLSPALSTHSKTGQVKQRGMGMSMWIWLLGHPQLRSGLVGMAGDLGDIVPLITGVWLQRFVWLQCPGHRLLSRDTPAERQSSVLPQNKRVALLGKAPSSQEFHSMSSCQRGAENLKTCQSSAGMRRGSPRGALLIGSC